MSSFRSFGDVQVFQQDLASVYDGQWITDAIIALAYERLRQHDKRVCLLDPSVVHLVSQIHDSEWLASALPPDLHQSPMIFMPVNNNNTTGVGGSHWSLVVFDRPSSTWYYYDSIGSMNLPFAQRIVAKLTLWTGTTHFAIVDTPNQVNGYDCGVYVIFITELLLSRFAHRASVTDKPGDLSRWRLSSVITPSQISSKRLELESFIESLRKT